MTVKSTIFIPKKIRVGYQARKDTYTQRLAYVIYYDAKGKLRKERSWEQWRHKDISPDEYENKPTEGFVLNKKVGDYVSDWNHRQAYCRVYDPRGFEFEITVENLLYILENTDSIKGKGLVGEFVYGWDGTELILMPVSSPDYGALVKFSTALSSSVLSKDLVLGGTYLSNKNQRLVYMGRFDCYADDWHYNSETRLEERVIANSGKQYFFYTDKLELITMKSISGRVIEVLSQTPVENYAELMDRLECNRKYSPHDRYEYVTYALEDINDRIVFRGVYTEIRGTMDNVPFVVDYNDRGTRTGRLRINKPYYFRVYGDEEYERIKTFYDSLPNNATLEEYFNLFTFYKRVEYLRNGKILKEE